MIEFHNVAKRFGKIPVLHGISLTIEPGRAVAVLGPNASGKTTLLKCLLGLVRPDAGEIRVDGLSIAHSPDYRRRIGYMPQQPHFPENLRVVEVIELVKRVRGITTSVELPYIERFHLGTELQKPVRALSGGTRQKLSAVLALMIAPHILILDEPTAGLDPAATRAFKTELSQHRARGSTILLTTHVLSEVPELVDEVVFLLEGRLAFRESVAALMTSANSQHFDEALLYRLQQT
ncbi:MAG: ABC transporter ATP-binding protein [Candidatus Kapabacteria bacterium]|nr:ABC transporter ATP-binding protein [Candidatus Kapabacteria bacterium]MCS7169688.1 ABC transporter ATP-binding protein [Candidatus Kapabacteria bacterium]MDW7996404.1 ABC transporter ATP-binding protein [Bacteroidota bacterium]MDW8224866.1 ABC transporter ATP-binding protein [Bacteroidota bacterium]